MKSVSEIIMVALKKLAHIFMAHTCFRLPRNIDTDSSFTFNLIEWEKIVERNKRRGTCCERTDRPNDCSTFRYHRYKSISHVDPHLLRARKHCSINYFCRRKLYHTHLRFYIECPFTAHRRNNNERLNKK